MTLTVTKIDKTNDLLQFLERIAFIDWYQCIFPVLRLLIKYFQHSQQLHVVKTFNAIMIAAYRQIKNIILNEYDVTSN
jgi:hypothetical protein